MLLMLTPAQMSGLDFFAPTMLNCISNCVLGSQHLKRVRITILIDAIRPRLFCPNFLGRAGRSVSFATESQRKIVREIVKQSRNPVKSRVVPPQVHYDVYS